VRELVFGWEVEWVRAGRDGEVSPGREGGRHLVLSCWGVDGMNVRW
jgi:hypothetical protein